MDAPLIGQTLGPYTIRQELGAGGMGVVYLAQDTRLGRLVALKVLRPEVVGDPHHRRRIVREAQAASALNHPHIVTIYDVGDDEVAFIAMEYVDGPSLAHILAGGPLPARDAVRYAAQIADALAAAHGAGMVHRDLKPANILITRDHRAKVLDFGIATISSAGDRDTALDAVQPTITATSIGSVVGTSAYMSPEQAEGRPVDERSDIFSFGALLYEMLAGRRAFAGATPLAVLAAVTAKEPKPLSALVAGLPPELDRIVLRCLQKDPERRFQHMTDVRVALREIGDRENAPPFTTSRERSWRVPLAIGAGLIVVGAMWVGWRSVGGAARPARQELVSTFSGSHWAPSFSPDGGFVAFLQDVGGTSQVFVKNLARGEPIQITSADVAAERPRWSPANDQIVFARTRQGIWSIPPLGGEPRRLLENGYNPNFSADGRQLVYERGREIWMAAADGSGAHKIEGVPLRNFTESAASPALSPDGRTIAFFIQEAGPNGDFWTIPTTGGQAKRLTFDFHEGGQPVWTRDGAIVFWSRRNGSATLWRIAADGGTPQPITTGAGDDSDPDIAPDGRVIFTNARNDWSLTITSPATSTSATLLQRRSAVWLPKLSADEQSIAFFHDIGPDVQIFVMRIEGGTPRQLTFATGERNIHPTWSPDGKFVYYYHDYPPPYAFRRLPVAGGDSVEIAANWQWPTHNHASIDPTGARVLYLRQIPGQPEATLVRDLASGQEELISEAGPKHLHDGSWSPDGQSILGWRHGDQIVICPSTAGGSCKDLTHGDNPTWPTDGSRVYFTRRVARPGYTEIWSIQNDGSDERKIAEIGPLAPLNGGFDVTARGDIVWVQFLQGRRELWLTELPDR